MKRTSKMCLMMMGLVVASGLYVSGLERPKTELIQYQKQVAMGDTVWSICKEIATDDEDLIALVDQTMKDNYIRNPDQLTPGSVIVVNVQQARKR